MIKEISLFEELYVLPEAVKTCHGAEILHRGTGNEKKMVTGTIPYSTNKAKQTKNKIFCH
jgi:hypothetical protein